MLLRNKRDHSTAYMSPRPTQSISTSKTYLEKPQYMGLSRFTAECVQALIIKKTDQLVLQPENRPIDNNSETKYILPGTLTIMICINAREDLIMI